MELKVGISTSTIHARNSSGLFSPMLTLITARLLMLDRFYTEHLERNLSTTLMLSMLCPMLSMHSPDRMPLVVLTLSSRQPVFSRWREPLTVELCLHPTHGTSMLPILPFHSTLLTASTTALMFLMREVSFFLRQLLICIVGARTLSSLLSYSLTDRTDSLSGRALTSTLFSHSSTTHVHLTLVSISIHLL